ncbi:hypothetical protein ESOMN_v1c02520 [Williamsoniiplasma somnilux]|uniref:Lipoprotein n=1 Tax=Williamsoniiplasma somnilux TaxID=215578 RepID=A0A2K8NYL4_9MOLU|nr:lipoprotein [Williamsoniiplasma somnilux]ATZ18636.1 hypothetical protein ESOMN_v1c02520 [Williamsoniiplasma somnilux]
MKKLLTLLGAISITASSAALVVSCGSKEEDKSEGSTFIDNKGNIKFNSEDLLNWYISLNGFGDHIKIVKSFYQIFAVAVMQESKKDDSKLFNAIFNKENNYYALNSNKDSKNNMKKIISDLLGDMDSTETYTVYGAAINSFKKKEKEVDNREKLVDELAKQFPNVDKNYDALRKAYINNLVLTDPKTGAYAQLSNLLIKKSQTNIADMTSNTELNRNTLLEQLMEKWQNVKTSELANKIVEEKDNNKELLINLFNATGGFNNITENTQSQTRFDSQNKKIWNIYDIKWADESSISTLTVNNAKELLKRIVPAFGTANVDEKTLKEAIYINNVYNLASPSQWNTVLFDGKELNSQNSYFDLVASYPTKADDLNLNTNTDSELYGFLSNSQRFVVDSFFQNQKPLAITEVVFNKGTGDLAKEINGEAFFDKTTTTDAKQFTGLMDFLNNYVTGAKTIEGTSQSPFDTIFANQNKANNGKIFVKNNEAWNTDSSNYYTTKNDSELLTLSDSSHSKITKYSVYDFLQTQGNIEEFDIADNAIEVESRDDLEDPEKGAFLPDNATAIANVIKSLPDENQQSEAWAKLGQALGLIKSLNRKVNQDGTGEFSTSDKQSDNKVYKVLNKELGIIAFMDTDGLHITKISGFDILKGSELLSAQKTVDFENDKVGYLKDAQTLQKINNYAKGQTNGDYRYIFGDYKGAFKPNSVSSSQLNKTKNKAANDTTKEESMEFISADRIEDIKKLGLDYSRINSSISNKYEQYLVNNSIGTNIKDSNSTIDTIAKYNIIDAAFNYATAKDSSTTELSLGASWMFDYFVSITGQQQIDQVIEWLIEFDETNSLSKKFKQDLTNKINYLTSLTIMKGQNDFKDGWDEWNKSIDDSKLESGFGGKNKDLPLSKLDYNTKSEQENSVDEAKLSITKEELTSHIDKLIQLQWFDPFKTSSVSRNKYATQANDLIEWKFTKSLINDFVKTQTTYDLNNRKIGGKK